MKKVDVVSATARKKGIRSHLRPLIKFNAFYECKQCDTCGVLFLLFSLNELRVGIVFDPSHSKMKEKKI